MLPLITSEPFFEHYEREYNKLVAKLVLNYEHYVTELIYDLGVPMLQLSRIQLLTADQSKENTFYDSGSSSSVFIMFNDINLFFVTSLHVGQ
jgi:hypothetical protein